MGRTTYYDRVESFQSEEARELAWLETNLKLVDTACTAWLNKRGLFSGRTHGYLATTAVKL